MDFRILGPLEVTDRGRRIELGGRKQRALLAILLLRGNEVVPADKLIDELWGETPPPTAPKTLQAHISRLRRSISTDDPSKDEEGPLETRGHGYVLRVEPEQLDAERFQRLLADGRRALARGEPEPAAEKVGEALALWRGPALADFAYESFAQADIARLEELRLSALEERVEADLALGRDAEIVGELEALVSRHPLRERLRGQLMLALYRSDRQAEALEVYQRGRRALAEELGLEPSQALQRLERQILEHDPVLAAVRTERSSIDAATPSRRRRRGLLIALGIIAAVAAAVIAAVVLGRRGDSEPVIVTPNSVAVIDPATTQIVDAIPVGESPGPIAADRASLWVVNLNDRTLMKIAAAARSVVASVGLPTATGRLSPKLRLAVAPDDVWVYACHLELFRVNRGNAQIVQEVEVFRDTGAFADYSCAVAADADSVWVPIDLPRQLLRVAASKDETASIAERFRLPAGIRSAITLGGGSVWIADSITGAVRRIDPATGAVIATIPLDAGPSAMVFGHGSVWVTNDKEDSVLRIRPSTNSVVRAISVGADPVALAVGADAVWVANSGDGTLSRIDPATSTVTETIRVGHRPLGVAVADGLVWVTVRS
jgi:YVTN family beta-propeller protein